LSGTASDANVFLGHHLEASKTMAIVGGNRPNLRAFYYSGEHQFPIVLMLDMRSIAVVLGILFPFARSARFRTVLVQLLINVAIVRLSLLLKPAIISGLS